MGENAVLISLEFMHAKTNGTSEMQNMQLICILHVQFCTVQPNCASFSEVGPQEEDWLQTANTLFFFFLHCSVTWLQYFKYDCL